MRIGGGFLLAMLISLFSCAQEKKPHVNYIKYGWSFGMCAGTCFYEARYDSARIIIKTESINKEKESVHDGSNNTPLDTKTDTTPVTKAKWDSLVAAFIPHKDEVFALKEIIGCPDCLDGGAEWIEVSCDGKAHRVEFDYHAPPSAISHLVYLLESK